MAGMTLLEWYPQIRRVHMGLVLVSGALFAARGMGVLTGARWSMTQAVRRLSYSIDTGLLAAALLMLYAAHINPFTVSWISTKIALLLVYIVLGTLALKRARTRTVRLACFVASLFCFGFMLSVARAHQPLGIFAGLTT